MTKATMFLLALSLWLLCAAPAFAVTSVHVQAQQDVAAISQAPAGYLIPALGEVMGSPEQVLSSTTSGSNKPLPIPGILLLAATPLLFTLRFNLRTYHLLPTWRSPVTSLRESKEVIPLQGGKPQRTQAFA